jgi:hypothetical protein
MADAQHFTATVNAWIAQRQDALQKVARSSIQDVCDAVIEGTRFDIGNLRSQWQPSIGAPVLSLAPQGNDPSAALALVLGQITPGTVMYLSNNAAYALRMEYGFVGKDKLRREYNQKGDYNVQTQVARWPMLVAKNAEEFGFGL